MKNKTLELEKRNLAVLSKTNNIIQVITIIILNVDFI
jgi:hypothetical protein